MLFGIVPILGSQTRTPIQPLKRVWNLEKDLADDRPALETSFDRIGFSCAGRQRNTFTFGCIFKASQNVFLG